MIVGIAGRKRAGKDTIANILCEMGFIRQAFADPVKDGLKAFFDWDDSHLNENKEVIDERWGITPREAMQKIATDIMQYSICTLMPGLRVKMNECSGSRNFWTHRFDLWYIKQNKNIKVVVPDVRFIHEAEYIKSKGGVIIRVNRNTNENEYSKHLSEKELSSVEADFVIDNNGTLEELRNEVNKIYEHLSWVE